MDDGYSPVGILVLIGLIFLEAVFYGFGSAIQNVNEGKLEEEMENGNEKAARLLRIVNRPTRFVNTIQITTHLVGIITGIFILPVVVNAAAGKFRTMNLLSSARTMEAVGGTGSRLVCGPAVVDVGGAYGAVYRGRGGVYRQLRHHYPQASGRQGAGEMGLPHDAHGAVCRGHSAAAHQADQRNGVAGAQSLWCGYDGRR